jgi:hypothetical protein
MSLPMSFEWVASGKVSIRRRSRAQKRLAQEGLRFPAKQLNLDQFCTTRSRRS